MSSARAFYVLRCVQPIGPLCTSGHSYPDQLKPQAENPCFKIRSFTAELRLLKLCIWRVIMRNILYLLDDVINVQEDKKADYIFAQLPLHDKG